MLLYENEAPGLEQPVVVTLATTRWKISRNARMGESEVWVVARTLMLAATSQKYHKSVQRIKSARFHQHKPTKN